MSELARKMGPEAIDMVSETIRKIQAYAPYVRD